MSRNWEDAFSTWAKPPGKTEEERSENAIRAIRNAIARSDILKSRGVRIFVQGSYRNNVNVRKESDVDVGVMCHDFFLVEYPPGKTNADYGNIDADYSFRQFKDELEVALVDYFGRSAVVRGNKAFDIHENSYHVEADVAPFLEFRQYFESGSCRCGVALVPDNGGRIENYPERLLESWPHINQHYENGVKKNNATSRAFKGVVRILKTLRHEMEEREIAAAKSVPGFLIECMTWNVPNSCFSHSTWDSVVQAVLSHLWSNTRDDATCKDWCEVNDIKYLFHISQRWTRAQAHAFVDAAWSYVGVR
jgi:hypothetical protein